GEWKAAKERSGRSFDEESERKYLVRVGGYVTGGRLSLEWNYSARIHEEETIERLGGMYLEELRKLIEHCRREGVRGYTPSDFELARVEQEELDRLAEREEEIEDIYPLSPLQEGLLFHTVYEPGTYSLAFRWRVAGDLDFTVFDRAWQELINRHLALRTSFEWERVSHPIQIVHKRAEFKVEHHDWRRMSEQEQERQLNQKEAAAGKREFNLRRCPLMGMEVIRLGGESYEMIWSFHHLLLDGWSTAQIINEVMTYYISYIKGQQAPLGEVSSYRKYIEWLQKQDSRHAEKYWRRKLEGIGR